MVNRPVNTLRSNCRASARQTAHSTATCVRTLCGRLPGALVPRHVSHRDGPRNTGIQTPRRHSSHLNATPTSLRRTLPRTRLRKISHMSISHLRRKRPTTVWWSGSVTPPAKHRNPQKRTSRPSFITQGRRQRSGPRLSSLIARAISASAGAKKTRPATPNVTSRHRRQDARISVPLRWS